MVLENSLLVLLALFLVALNGFFVASEFAIVKLRHTRVDDLRRSKGWRGRILGKVHGQMDAYLSACQLGITLASLGLGWIGEPAFARLLEPALVYVGLEDNPESIHVIAFVIAFSLISYLHIVIGELAPKSMALRQPEGVSLWTAIPLYLFYWLMYPFIWVLNASANRVLRAVGLQSAGESAHEMPYTHEELRMIVHHSRESDEELEPEINAMLAHTLELPHLEVSDLMRQPREMIGLHTDDTHADVRRIIQQHRYSRYPLLDAISGEPLGLVHVKDALLEPAGADFQVRLRNHLHPLERLSEHEPVADVLKRFRKGAPHFALVEDEVGHLSGFLTMEDVLEAIFGDITDEHETRRPQQIQRKPVWLRDGSLIARGDTPLFHIERQLGVTLPDTEEISTLSGFLMERLGRMPKAGDRVDIGELLAEVQSVNGPRIDRVKLTPRS
jgi:CBS domain containing-hemolysin-like protein